MSSQIYQQFIEPKLLDPAAMTPEEIRQQIVSQQLAKATQQTGSLGPTAPVDINGFYELAQKIITGQQQREGATDLIEFAEEYPPTKYDCETVTFRLTRREPATLSSDAPFSNGVRNYRPLHRESFSDPDNPGHNIHTFVLFFDNIVELTCWANTNAQVNYRANWLEETMLANAWCFTYNGIAKLIYYGQAQDTRQEKDNIRLMFRSLSYYVRTQKIYTLREKTIDDILVNFQLAQA